MREPISDYHPDTNINEIAERSDDPRQSPEVGTLRFVVQKHDATRLHYDFRLEYEGALKSWAVTKEPTGKVGSRRLAVQVDDHPLDYADFEGTIPDGEYGAGSVVLWDSGTWTPDGDPGRGFEQGKITFELAGSVMQGRWTLVRFRQCGRPDARKTDWLLIKRSDVSKR